MNALTINRNKELLIKHLSRPESTGTKSAVLFVTLSNLSLINNLFGYETGDSILKEVEHLFSHCLENASHVARYGINDFVVIMDHLVSHEEAACLASQILALLSHSSKKQRDFGLSAAIGISIGPEHGDNPALLIRHAATAMHRAKELGGRRFLFFHESMIGDAQEMILADKIAHEALETNALLLHYQPQFDLQTMDICGVEALLRLKEPCNVSIGGIVQASEKSGAIIEIGHWVFNEACRQLAAWEEKKLGFRVAVNVSVSQLVHEAFLHQVDEVLLLHGVSPAQIEIEVTESQPVLQDCRCIATLAELRNRDFHITVDDFGSGYANLAALCRLHVDKIKIDRSLFEGIPESKESATVIRAIVQLCKEMGIRVLAEGVETKEQLEFIKAAGCDFVQGFYTGRPMTPDSVTDLLLLRKNLPKRSPFNAAPPVVDHAATS